MQLPRALQPWSSLLTLFPHDLALSLGTLVHRLNAVVGPLRDDRIQGLTDPEGVQGIAARGLYERLLLTEWLLADEVPEEFDRRAAAHEHLFYDRALKDPSATRQSVALFDCGPDQIGAPRIVQLAVLILLARRAEAAGAQFLWGVIQDQDFGLRQAVDHAEVKHFVGARTSVAVTPRRLDAWQSRSLWEHDCDQWVVGSRVGVDAWPYANGIIVEDALDLQRDALHVTVKRGRHRATLDLELPRRNAVRARLLRDPFEQPIRSSVSSARHPISLKRQIRFSEDGRRVLAVLLDGGLGAFHIPNTPAVEAGRTRTRGISRDHRLIAATYAGRRFVAVTQMEDEICLIQQTPAGDVVSVVLNESEEQPVPVHNRGFFPRCVASMARQPGAADIFFIDGSKQLFFVDVQSMRMRRIDHGVHDFLLLGSELVYAHGRHLPSNHRLVIVDWDGRCTDRTSLATVSTERTQVFFGNKYSWYRGSLGEIAVTGSVHGFWDVFVSDGHHRVEVPPGHRVFGFAGFGEERRRGLVSIRPDGIGLTLHHRRGQTPLITPSEPIVQAAVHPESQAVAYLTETGTLGAYSIATRKTLVTFEQQEER